MGCWNATCAISRMPILNNDDVICWLIVGTNSDEYKNSASNYCYPWDKYQLLGFPFHAKYNDYGSVEDIVEEDKGVFNLMLEYIRSNMIEYQPGENEYHDIEVTKKNLDEEILFEAIHEERLAIKGFYREHLPIGLMMIHKGIYDKLVKEYTYRTYRVREDESWEWYDTTYDFQAVADGIKEKLFKRLGGLSKVLDDDKYQDAWESHIARFVMMEEARDMEGVDAMIESAPKEMRDDLLVRLAMNKALYMFAHTLRFPIEPQCGAGSQSQEFEAYSILMAGMQERIDEYNKQCYE